MRRGAKAKNGSCPVEAAWKASAAVRLDPPPPFHTLGSERQRAELEIHSEFALWHLDALSSHQHLPHVHAHVLITSMDHSTAILDDARKTLDTAGGAPTSATTKSETVDSDRKPTSTNVDGEWRSGKGDEGERRGNDRKRKADFRSDRQHFGSRGGGGGRGGRGGRDDGKRHKKGDMGRGEYL